MDTLTQKNTSEFIKVLQSFNSKAGVKHRNLSIIEPRGFDLIIQKLGSKKVLELERVSDSCEQICNEYDIEYKGVYSHIYAKRNCKLPETWDGDIIMGLVPMKDCCTLICQAMPLLQEGRFFAIFQRYNFVESWNRYLSLFKNNPFNKMYITPGRVQVSSDGVFRDTSMPSCNGAWYVWEKGNSSAPTIEWVSDELWDKYFFQDEMTGRVLKHGMYSRVYKKPPVVTVDRGTNSQTKEAKAARKAQLVAAGKITVDKM